MMRPAFPAFQDTDFSSNSLGEKPLIALIAELRLNHLGCERP